MKNAILFFAAGAAIGYILGTRDGKERYQQLRDAASSLTERPEVKKAVQSAKDTISTAREKTTALWDKSTTGGSSAGA